MKTVFSKVTALTVIVFTCLFLVLTLTSKKDEYSVNENRKLKDFPEISASSLIYGDFGKKVSEYFADRFAGRNVWLSMRAEFEAQAGDSISNGIWVSKKMMLDTGFSSQSYADENAETVNRFLDVYEGNVYVAVLPDSSGIYSDLLPPYKSVVSQKQRIDYFYSLLNSSIRKINAYNILKAQSENYIYYRTDTRPTAYGAYYVYRTVIRKLGLPPIEYDKYSIQHITDKFRGNLYHKSQYMGTKPDILDIYVCSDGAEAVECTGYDNEGNSFEKKLLDMSFLESSDMYNIYLGSPEPLVRVKTSLNNGRKLLVIKDSYADCFIQFLLQHYSEIAIVSPEYMKEGLDSFIDPNDYEQTLLLFSIGTLSKKCGMDKICR